MQLDKEKSLGVGEDQDFKGFKGIQYYISDGKLLFSDSTVDKTR